MLARRALILVGTDTVVSVIHVIAQALDAEHGASITQVLLMTGQFKVLGPLTLSSLDLSGSWLGSEPEKARKDDLRWAQREPL